MNNKDQSTFKYLLSKRKHMLQIHLLKYLKYEDIVKFLLVCKDIGHLCDANKTEEDPEISD